MSRSKLTHMKTMGVDGPTITAMLAPSVYRALTHAHIHSLRPSPTYQQIEKYFQLNKRIEKLITLKKN